MDKTRGILEILKEPEIPTYGIFEGAIIKDLWLDVDLWNLESYPLYRGNSDPIAQAIPYLIRLDDKADKDACISLLSHFGKNAVLLMKTNLTADKLLEKFQYFYHEVVDGEPMLRRFYDPRVFRKFMEKMDFENRIRFFAGVESFYAENKKGQLIRYAKKEDLLLTQETGLGVENEN